MYDATCCISIAMIMSWKYGLLRHLVRCTTYTQTAQPAVGALASHLRSDVDNVNDPLQGSIIGSRESKVTNHERQYLSRTQMNTNCR